MKKLVFRKGIYTVLRPLYYLCKLFGLASYSFVADGRNRRVATDYGYLNYTFTVIWLILFTVGFVFQILKLQSFDVKSKILFAAYILYITLSYTSSIVAVVWVSVVRRKRFLEIIENISEVDNKIRYTPQEETYMNRNVMFNIISEIILLKVIKCTAIIYYIHHTVSEPYYVIVMETISYVTSICNALILFQFLNLVFMMKQRNRHVNKCLTNWINETVSRPTYFKKEKERRSPSNRAVHNVIITHVCVSSVGNIEGTLRQTDIHLLRQIYTVSCMTYHVL